VSPSQRDFKNPSLSIAVYAKEYPEQVALVDCINSIERTFTYRNLERRVASLTSKLIEINISSGDRIAVISRNRVEVVEIFMAAWRIGAVPFCVNPGMSSKNIRVIFENSKPGVALVELPCDQALMDIIGNITGLKLIAIGEKKNGLLEYNSFIDKSYSEDSSKYFLDVPSMIIYTSGSTGFPKGVVRKVYNNDIEFPVTHAGVELFHKASDMLGYPTIVAFPLFHATGIGAALSIMYGSKVIILNYFDPSIFLSSLEKHRVKSCTILPSMLALCFREELLIRDLDFGKLKLITLNGAPCSSELIEKAKDRFQCQVYTLYGMTEGLPILTFDNIAQEDIPINCYGKAKVEGSVKLINTSGDEDVFGELWFKNESLMEGYYNQPKLTISKFDKGWFKTGDIFYRDKEGYYYYRGRKDEMFICDGENIYPLEIENILSQHEGVLLACVVALDDVTHGQIPVAMVVCRPDHRVDTKALLTHYLKTGPLYAYPRVIDLVDKLPTLGPGKVDRNEVKKRMIGRC
jgi:long-chain acyl-CoA synthetase